MTENELRSALAHERAENARMRAELERSRHPGKLVSDELFRNTTEMAVDVLNSDQDYFDTEVGWALRWIADNDLAASQSVTDNWEIETLTLCDDGKVRLLKDAA